MKCSLIENLEHVIQEGQTDETFHGNIHREMEASGTEANGVM